MDNNLEYSVIIPAYNRAGLIDRTIKSILNQSIRNYEIIVVDDGSSDNLKGTIEKYENNPNINLKYIYQDNQGACSARNKGLDNAHGRLLLFLDSDDEILPDFFLRVKKEFDKADYIGAVYCLTGYLKKGELALARKDVLTGNIYHEALKQGYITSSSFIVVRRDILIRNSIRWDEELPACQDDDFCFKVAKNTQVVLVPEILGIYNVDSDNSISGSRARVAEGWLKLWKKYESDVIKYCGKKTMVKHYNECMIRFLLLEEKSENLEYLENKLRCLLGNNRYLINKLYIYFSIKKRMIRNYLSKMKRRMISKA